MEVLKPVKRNVLLNPGPATTTDAVKYAQVVPDICPREKEFADIMRDIQKDLVKIVHGDPKEYCAVLFCGSGTINIDVLMNSLVPEGKKALVINNGAYSQRAVEVLTYYHIPYIDLKFPYDELPDLSLVEKTLAENPDIALVHTTHNETGTGILNPIREIGRLVHEAGAVFTVDTTSTLAMLPIDMEKDNLDFVMASSQKGLMAMTGLSFIVGKTRIIEKSKDYLTRSYYCNLYMQYDFIKRTGEMHFTPPVQIVFSVKQAIEEYWQEGEQGKYERHLRVWKKIHECKDRLGLKDIIRLEWQAGLVVSIKYPKDPNWSFEKIHDYCYERGFTIYPGKISTTDTFRLCALGAIDEADIVDFFQVLKEAMEFYKISIPAIY
jgi:2-aminoethylphosphonate-pyruvate transaminase